MKSSSDLDRLFPELMWLPRAVQRRWWKFRYDLGAVRQHRRFAKLPSDQRRRALSRD